MMRAKGMCDTREPAELQLERPQLTEAAAALAKASKKRRLHEAMHAGEHASSYAGGGIQDVQAVQQQPDPAEAVPAAPGRRLTYICNRCGEPKRGHWCKALYL